MIAVQGTISVITNFLSTRTVGVVRGSPRSANVFNTHDTNTKSVIVLQNGEQHYRST